MYSETLVMDRHTISDQDIQALIDNELNWEEEKRVRAHIAGDPKAGERYETLKAQKRLLQSWWRQRQTARH